MEHFNRNAAVEFVKVALQSTAIRFSSLPADEEAAARQAKVDAKYLVTLFNELIGPRNSAGAPTTQP